jgi:Leucine-rich repeat (LRR) protein
MNKNTSIPIIIGKNEKNLQKTVNLLAIVDKIIKSKDIRNLNESESWIYEFIAWLEDNDISETNHPLRKTPRGTKKDILEMTFFYPNELALTNLPESIGKLINLTKLNLGENQLIIIPDSIGNLKNLTYLSLGRNQLTTIPDSIGDLKKLTWLGLGRNQLTIIPDSIGKLIKLKFLDL